MKENDKPTIYEIFTMPLFERAPLITLQGLMLVCLLGAAAAIGWSTQPWR